MEKFFQLMTVVLAGSLCMGGACSRDPDCNYDHASELCKQAYNCCNQFLNYCEQTGDCPAGVLDCEGYTCADTTDMVCDQFIDQASKAEETYDQDWPDCN